MKERVINDNRLFSQEELLSRENLCLFVKRVKLVLPERARELGVDVKSDQPVFISDRPEDYKDKIYGLDFLSRLIYQGHPGEFYEYKVGESIKAQYYNNWSGGGLRVQSIADYYRSNSPEFYHELNQARRWNGGGWLAMVNAEKLRERDSIAKEVSVKQIRAICWFQWPGAESHLKELYEGLAVYDSSRESLFPICDVEEHPKQVQPRKLFDEGDIKYRFAIVEDGRVKFDPFGEKA